MFSQYSYREVLTYVREEDVKFIRLAFFDIFGVQKNISIMPDELERAFTEGISFDASAVAGFGDEVHSDLFLRPDSSTIAVLPWRPSHGRVARMYCDIYRPDGTLYQPDSRYLLKQAVATATKQGITVSFGPEVEFYLFETDEQGRPTKIPFDNAGYMDISPADKGENVRREICFTLIDMGVNPEASHHEEGPGQNEIDFRHSDALSAADNTSIFKWIVKTISARNGLHADFSPKPLLDQPGNGMHLNISVHNNHGIDYKNAFMAGVLEHIADMTIFLNPQEESYLRLGGKKAPRYITWSPENRSQLIRIPSAGKKYDRLELRSPDPSCNIYLAFALLIYAGLDGINRNLIPAEPCNLNLYTAGSEVTDTLKVLPENKAEAAKLARNSTFIQTLLPVEYLRAYCD